VVCLERLSYPKSGLLCLTRERFFRKRKRGISKSIAFCIYSITIHTYIPTCMLCIVHVRIRLLGCWRFEEESETAACMARGEGLRSRLLEDRQHAVRGMDTFLSMYHRRLKHGWLYIHYGEVTGCPALYRTFSLQRHPARPRFGPKGSLRALSSSTSSPKPSQGLPPTTRMHVLLSQYHH
jgi:hypothetical protein